MDKKIDKWLMLVIGLVGGWLIATFPGWVDAWGKEYWWNIATAFGTVGAVIAAVSADWRRNRVERRVLLTNARLLAPRMSVKLITLLSDLKLRLGKWEESAKPFEDTAARDEASAWVNEIRCQFEMNDLRTLSGAPSDFATHLSDGLMYLEMFSELLSRDHENSARKEKMLNSALSYAKLANDELIRAKAGCVTWTKWS